MMKRRSGKAYMTSVKRIRTLSMRPPNQPADRADRHADQQDDDLDDDRDAHADPGAVHEAAEQVTADLVGAEEVAPGSAAAAAGRRWRRRPAMSWSW